MTDYRQRYASSAVINGHRLSDHLGLVGKVVHRYGGFAGGKVGHDDLWQAGMIGLVKGLERHDPSRGAVSTCVVLWIRHEVGRLVRDQSRTVRIPCCRWGKGQQLPGRESSVDEQIEVNGAELRSDAPSPEDALAAGQEAETVRRALATLPARSRGILEARAEGATLDDIGQRLPRKLTRERVRQLEVVALGRMRKELSRTQPGEH